MTIPMKLPPVVVSRTDRIGDLILSLPVLHYLRKAGFSHISLHVSPYCRAIAEWAQFNGLVDYIWVSGEAPPPMIKKAAVLALVYARLAVKELKATQPTFILGPRTKLPALWSFHLSVAQHRSRVEKSEMRYNIDLAKAFCSALHCEAPAFEGLPALKLPSQWSSPRISPDCVLVVSNRGSAANWPIEKYIQMGLELRSQGKSVDFLVSGEDEAKRLAALKKAGVESQGCGVVTSFSDLRELIVYLACAQHVISSSTGPLHLAHAAGVAVTGIYPTKKVQSFERWRPDGYWHSKPVHLIEIGTS